MLQTSLLLPLRDAGPALDAALPELVAVLDAWARPYEVICVDDGSAPPTREALQRLLVDNPSLRVVRLEPAAGLSATLRTAVHAACGEDVVVWDLLCGHDPADVGRLLGQLARYDLVQGRAAPPGGPLVVRALRRLCGVATRHDRHLVCWAARREVMVELAWPGTEHWRLGALASSHDYRVGQLVLSPRTGAVPAERTDRAARGEASCEAASSGAPRHETSAERARRIANWLRRTSQSYRVCELGASDEPRPLAQMVRIDPPESRASQQAADASPNGAKRRAN